MVYEVPSICFVQFFLAVQAASHLETLWFNFEEYSSCGGCAIDEFVLQRGVVEVAHEAFHQDCCVGTVAESRLQFRYFSINISRYSLTNETKINTSGADCAK